MTASVMLRLRNRTYRRLCEAEEADSDQDGAPDVYEVRPPRPPTSQPLHV